MTDQPGLADDPLGLDFIEDKERLAFDLLEVRNIIEPAIAALAARHATPEDIAEMESLYNLMEYHILHGQDYLNEDMKFHRPLPAPAAICGSPAGSHHHGVGGGVHRGHPPHPAAGDPGHPQGSAGGHQVRRQHLGPGRHDPAPFPQPRPVPEDAPRPQR